MAINRPDHPNAMPRPVICCAIDDVALASLRQQQDEQVQCSLCDRDIEGEPGGTGLFMWARGDQIRFDEPPLCCECATTVGVTAFSLWTSTDDE